MPILQSLGTDPKVPNSESRHNPDTSGSQGSWHHTEDQLKRGTILEHTKEAQANTTMDPVEDLKLLRDLLRNPINLQKAIQHLQRLSLVVQRKEDGSMTLWLHDLVQLLLRTKLMDGQGRKKGLEQAIYIINEAIEQLDSPRDPRTWTSYSGYVAHIGALEKHAEDSGVESKLLLRAADRIAWYLLYVGRYEEAAKNFESLLDKQRNVLGVEHSHTLATMDKGEPHHPTTYGIRPPRCRTTHVRTHLFEMLYHGQ